MPERDDGTRTVDARAFEAARRELAARDRERAEEVARGRDALVAGALREGRIAPVHASSLRRALDVDPEGTAQLLTASERDGGLPRNTALPVEEIATAGGDVAASPADDAAQRAYYEQHFPGLAR